MSNTLRIILIISAVLVFFYMVKKIRQSKVKIEYAIFWLFFAFVLIIMGIFPELVYLLSGLMGFQSPVNLVFLMIIFVLIIKLFFMTLQISQLENKIDSLAQRIAINKKDDEK